VILGSGIDVIEVERVERALARHGRRFELRCFRPAEIAVCRRSRHPAPLYAQRFAAKEAVMKAVGTGWARGVRWVDIEVLEAEPGRSPRLRLHGRVAELAAGQGAHQLHLGLGRSRSLAVAVVLLEAGAP
jgi:holo-[acyl-carrier protein] synthase